MLKHTLDKGLTPSLLPPRFGITFSQGHGDPSNPHMQRILSAAAALLPDFRNDARDFTGLGRLKLVDTFVNHSHPLWWFNNATTLTVWALSPGQATVDLQVKC